MTSVNLQTKNQFQPQSKMSKKYYLDNIFNNLVSDIMDFSNTGLYFDNYSNKLFSPKVDIYEDDLHYCFEVELPAVGVEDINLKIDNNNLVIEGKKENLSQLNNKKYHMQERYFGSFLRTIMLPANVDANAIDAAFTNGVLYIKIAKKEESKTRKINIKTKKE